jgi:hypothetical protein
MPNQRKKYGGNKYISVGGGYGRDDYFDDKKTDDEVKRLRTYFVEKGTEYAFKERNPTAVRAVFIPKSSSVSKRNSSSMASKFSNGLGYVRNTVNNFVKNPFKTRMEQPIIEDVEEDQSSQSSGRSSKARRLRALLPLPPRISGGKKSSKHVRKEILGKIRCVYKVPGSRKDYIKYKGKLIAVKKYKEIMKKKYKQKL